MKTIEEVITWLEIIIEFLGLQDCKVEEKKINDAICSVLGGLLFFIQGEQIQMPNEIRDGFERMVTSVRNRGKVSRITKRMFEPISPLGSNWEKVEVKLFTPEELKDSEKRVEKINKEIKEKEIIEEFKRDNGIVCQTYMMFGYPSQEDFENRKEKEFKDLIFEPHAIGENGLQSKLFFENGYGVSVVRFKLTFGENAPLDPKDYYGSYTNNEDEWEVAVLEGNKESWEITEKEGDPWIEGYLTAEEVTTLMKEVQQLGEKNE